MGYPVPEGDLKVGQGVSREVFSERVGGCQSSPVQG